MPEIIDWGALYRGFTAPVTRINCGALCSKNNNGTPVCCNNNLHVPILFADELRWHTTSKNSLWHKRRSKTAFDKKQAAECADYIKYCHCNGAQKCRRSLRSLTCRFFPFEPYIAEDGTFVGITYLYRAGNDCPLVDNPAIDVTKAYVRQSIKIWRRIFDFFPDEFELYVEESRKLRRLFKKQNRIIKVFAV